MAVSGGGPSVSGPTGLKLYLLVSFRCQFIFAYIVCHFYPVNITHRSFFRYNINNNIVNNFLVHNFGIV